MADITLENLKIAFDKTPVEIIEYFESLGVILNDDWEDYIKNFNTDAFTIAGLNNAQHLYDAKELIEEAIREGTDLKVFKDTLKFGLELKSWHADLVVTQNISNAYNAGRYYQQINDPDDEFPFVRPIAMNDSKSTDTCKWLSGQNICFRINDQLLKNMYSPRHFKCRTIFVAISEQQAKRMELTVKDIKDIPEKYWNAKEFRNLPTDKFTPDVSKFPKFIQEKIL